MPSLICVHARLGLILGLFAWSSAAPARAADAPERGATPVLVEWTGRVVCLVEEMHQRHGTELPTRHDHMWGFRKDDGRCYGILPGKFSEAILGDERVRAKELRIKARLLPGTQLLELTYFRSVKNGVEQDLYYYCDVCAIRTMSPQVCACCQAPVKLIEEPRVHSGEAP